MDDKKDKAIEFFMETMKQDGVAVSTVPDGTVLLFKRSWLEDILKKYPDEILSIFVKKRDFKN